jgi:tryptophan synthase alpha chain
MTPATPRAAHGVEAISATFAQAHAEGRAAFMPYWMLGYPDMPTSIQIVGALIEAGADAIEIGVPFSDPVADGPIVQAAGSVALNNGTTLADCVAAVRTLRANYPDRQIPFLMMSYYNPMLAYALDRYVADVAAAGADGFIVPDLLPEESGELRALCDAKKLALVEFLAPTSNADRIGLVAQTAQGFVYVVSVMGVTGVREAVAADLAAFLDRVRTQTSIPLVIGFGINRPEQAAQIGKIADGIIVGSALVREGKNGVEAVRALATSLRGAL